MTCSKLCQISLRASLKRFQLDAQSVIFPVPDKAQEWLFHYSLLIRHWNFTHDLWIVWREVSYVYECSFKYVLSLLVYFVFDVVIFYTNQ